MARTINKEYRLTFPPASIYRVPEPPIDWRDAGRTVRRLRRTHRRRLRARQVHRMGAPRPVHLWMGAYEARTWRLTLRRCRTGFRRDRQGPVFRRFDRLRGRRSLSARGGGDPAQGWKPMFRRDCRNVLEIDAATARSAVDRHGGWVVWQELVRRGRKEHTITVGAEAWIPVRANKRL